MIVCRYPYRLTPAKLVGTDLAHALLLVLVAGMGHLMIDKVGFSMLGWLLLGSIPGVVLGSIASTRASATRVVCAIAVVLASIGIRLLA